MKRLGFAVLGWIGIIGFFCLVDYALRIPDGNMRTGGLGDSLGEHAEWVIVAFAIVPFGLAFWKHSKGFALVVMGTMVPVTILTILFGSLFYACATGIGCV